MKAFNVVQIDYLLALLVADDSHAKRSNQPFPLTIVFVETKVCLTLYILLMHFKLYFSIVIYITILGKVLILEYGLHVDKVQ